MVKSVKDLIQLKKPLKNLKVHYENNTGSTLIDKSQNGNNSAIDGTVTDATGPKGQNIKRFNANGNIKFPWRPDGTFLYPYKIKTIYPVFEAYQGLTGDGTYYYGTTNTSLIKYNPDWSVALRNDNIQTNMGATHCGDIKYYDNKIYMVTENYTSSPCGATGQKIGVFNATTLEYIESEDISAQNKEVSGITVNPDDGLLYVTCYCDSSPNYLYKYSLSDFSYQGTVSLTGGVPDHIQGLDYFGGDVYISTNTVLYRFGKDGVYKETIALAPNTGNPRCQGIHMVSENLAYFILYNSADFGLFQLTKPNNKFTIILWMNTSYLPSELSTTVMRLFASESDKLALFYRKSPAQLELIFSTPAGSGSSSTRARILQADNLLSKTGWQMITVTFDGTTAKVFVNDARQGSVANYTTGGNLLINSYINLTIGGSNTSSPTYRFIGDMGEFSGFEYTALTSKQIKDYYNATKSKYGL